MKSIQGKAHFLEAVEKLQSFSAEEEEEEDETPENLKSKF